MSVDPEQATPEEGSAATTETPASPENWEQRYKDTQAWGTKAQQDLRAEQAVWEDEQAALARFQEKFPHLIAEPDEEEPVTPDSPTPDPDLAELKQFKQQYEQEQQAAQFNAEWTGWEQYVQAQAKELDANITARDLKAMRLDSVDTDGYPVPQDKAAEVLKAYIEERDGWLEEQFAARKKRPNPPHTPPAGTAPEPSSTDDMSIQDLTKHMAGRLAAEST